MYASLLVKTNRISRIFDSARKSAKRPSFISPRSQMLITAVLVAIQVSFSSKFECSSQVYQCSLPTKSIDT